MRKSRHKHHIYTLVINKKSSSALVAAIAALIITIACIGISSDSKNIYSQIYSACLKSFSVLRNKPADIISLNALKPEIKTVMQTAAPIFASAEYKEKNDDFTSSDTTSHQTTAATPVQENKVSEKSIISKNLSSKNETAYAPDLHQLSLKPVVYDASGESPKVLILHTHACESYSDKNGIGLGEAGTYRSTDNARNMVAIGEKLTANLSESGINVIHDKTQCDYPSYNDAYKNSLEVANRYLSEYPSINFVFDIHRDAITDENNNPAKLTYISNGTKAAQIMIVCGTDELGLYHPNWQDNLTLAVKIQAYLENNHPGIARPLNIRRERFNMHTTKGSLIFEIGTHGNTIDEALLSADILSEALKNVLLNR